MSFDNPTNRGRALKIVDTLSHVEKSAASNKASTDEIAEICAPVVEMLRHMGALPPALTLTPADADRAAEIGPKDAPEPPAERAAGLGFILNDEPPMRAAEVPGGRWSASENAPAWAIIRDAAASAPLSDLAAAMAVMATRIDEGLAALKGAQR